MMKSKSMKLMKLMILLGIAGVLSAQQSLPTDVVNRNALVEIEFDNLTDFYRWCRPNPESCLAALCSEVEALEPIAESIISVVDALELETCPVTLLYQSGVPYTLTASGRYCLAEDLTVTCTPAAITINGSGITLDLNGHTIILGFDDCVGALGVAVLGDDAPNGDIVIKNGTFLGASELETIGIWLGFDEAEVDDVRIEDVAFSNLNGPNSGGVFVSGAVGTVINNAYFNNNDNYDIFCTEDSATVITNSTFTQSTYGITYCGSHNAVVRDCFFSGLTIAIQSITCSDNALDVAEFIHCVAADMDADAFSIANASSVVFTDCTATENCGIGFNITDSEDVVLRDCVASRDDYGFNIVGSTDVCLYNCFSQFNIVNGFNVMGSSVLARNCSSTSNSIFGFFDNNETNQYYANYACNNGINYGFFASVTSPDNMRGVYNVDCKSTDADQINTIKSVVENISDVVNAVCSCSLITEIVTEIDEQLFALSSAVDELAHDDCSVTLVSAPTIITHSGRYCLTQDVVGTFTIAANNVTLDLNGHTVYIPAGDNGIFVTGYDDIIIKNGSVDGQGVGLYGIAAEIIHDLRIEDVSCTNCGAAGIALFAAYNVVINNVMSYKNNLYGLAFDNVYSLLVQSSLFNGNGQFGVAGELGHNSEFVNCVANANQGAVIASGSGFAFFEANNLILRDCVASNNRSHMSDGFNVSDSTNVCLYNCYAKSNSSSGFRIGSSTVFVRNCTAINNDNYGFYDQDSNQYYANYACNNGSGNYFGVTMAPVTSPANARDFSNVSCNSPDVDQIAMIFGCHTCP